MTNNIVVVLFLCLQTVGNLALMRAVFVGAHAIDWFVAGGFTAIALVVLVRLGPPRGDGGVFSPELDVRSSWFT